MRRAMEAAGRRRVNNNKRGRESFLEGRVEGVASSNITFSGARRSEVLLAFNLVVLAEDTRGSL